MDSLVEVPLQTVVQSAIVCSVRKANTNQTPKLSITRSQNKVTPCFLRNTLMSLATP